MSSFGQGAQNAEDIAQIFNDASVGLKFVGGADGMVHAKLSPEQFAAWEKVQTENPALAKRTFDSIHFQTDPATHEIFIDTKGNLSTLSTELVTFESRKDVAKALFSGGDVDKSILRAEINLVAVMTPDEVYYYSKEKVRDQEKAAATATMTAPTVPSPVPTAAMPPTPLVTAPEPRYYDNRANEVYHHPEAQQPPALAANNPAAVGLLSTARPITVEPPALGDAVIPAKTFRDSDKALVQEVQGDIGVTADGKIGAKTLDAYASKKMNFDANNGVDMTLPDKPLPTKEVIMAAEHDALKAELAKALGRDPAAINRDGKLDKQDLNDIAAFQNSRKDLEKTGKLDEKTIAALEQVNGMKIDDMALRKIRYDQELGNKAATPDATPSKAVSQGKGL